MTAEPVEQAPEPAAKKPAKVVVPIRMALAGKCLSQALAEEAGEDYTALMRDVVSEGMKARLNALPPNKRKAALVRTAELEAAALAKIAEKGK